MAFREGSPPQSILFAATGREIVAADVLTGAILWRQKIGDRRGSSLVRIGLIGDEAIVAARDNDLCAFDQATGAVRWKVECPIAAEALVVSPHRRILAARGGEVACFDESGKLLWHELLGGEGPVSLAIDGVVLQADEVKR